MAVRDGKPAIMALVILVAVCRFGRIEAVDKAVPAKPRTTKTSTLKWTTFTKSAVDSSKAPAGMRLRGASTAAGQAAQQELPPWRDTRLPLADRIADLVAILTLEEKLSLMGNGQAAVERLGIPPYQFWTECLHGHMEKGSGTIPTTFPQPLLLASTFDDGLAWEVFSAISDELRAKDNAEFAKTGARKGLICWTPHINIFKDPRWGRGSETFGEDPFLTARMGLRVVQGLQGSDKSYKKVVATCKHFLGYGLEGAEGWSRYSHNIDIAPQDLTDTDLPPFKSCVQSGHATGIMCAYNAVNGTPSCSNDALMNGLLRSNMSFDGYVVSDCNAISGLVWGHKAYPSLTEAAAAAVKAGVDMFCENSKEIKPAVEAGLLTATDIDVAVNRTLAMRFMTGQFDPPTDNPWAGLELSTVNGNVSRHLARTVVQKGVVLLKNIPATAASSAPLLPLNAASLKKLCVVGPLANSTEHMMGNYYGNFNASVAATPLQGIQEHLAGSDVEVSYALGMDIMNQIHYDWPLETALQECEGADAAIVVVGSSMIENEKNKDGSFRPSHEGEGQDRNNLELPGRQADLIKALEKRAPGLPLVVLLMHGGGLDMGWVDRSPAVAAMLAVCFPGQEGGRGIADILFGAVSPSGRLPITWYHSNYTAAVSPLDLRMRPDAAAGHPGRSYRFVPDASYTLYPFGFGLSYTTFTYSGIRLLRDGEDGCEALSQQPAFCLRLTVTNTGRVAAEHVVPLYLSHQIAKGRDGYPLQSLRAFKRTKLLQPGAAETLEMLLNRGDFLMPRPDGVNALHLGPWKFSLGTWDAPVIGQAGPDSAAVRHAAGSGTQVGSQVGAAVVYDVKLRDAAAATQQQG